MNKKTLDVFNTGRREDGVKSKENCYNSQRRQRRKKMEIVKSCKALCSRVKALER